MATININRRTAIGCAVGLAAAVTLARPYIANAQAKTATIWVGQGLQEDAALLSSSFCDGTTKMRSYCLAPVKPSSTSFHIWGDLAEKAGFKMSGVPDKWDGRWNFFKPAQKALRAKRMRKMYAIGLQVTTAGQNDGNNLFYHFLIANGGLGRWCPAIPQVIKDGPRWTDTKLDPHRARYGHETVLGPTLPNYIGYNPALGQASAEQLWGQCQAGVIKNGLTPAAAVDHAFKRADAIFARFSFSRPLAGEHKHHLAAGRCRRRRAALPRKPRRRFGSIEGLTPRDQPR